MSLTIFHVESSVVSVRFYEKLLARAPVEASPTFTMFALGGGGMLGLSPMDLDFGRNFLAVDPDQHRLRVFKPAM